ncbi:MAG TPA: glutamine synthetase family protein [Conexibacter sp.]|nr:glutamine synthetase family protein [Conexibacter sp.]
MSDSELTVFAFCDLGSIVRARAVPRDELEQQARVGVGWVPSAHARPPFGPSAQPNPFGAVGDLRLRPDIATRATVAAADGASALDLVLCDMVELDGRPWSCCPRTFLRDALDELDELLGARLLSSFEHEFQLLSSTSAAPPMSLEALRAVDPFPMRLVGALSEAGVAPERFVSERSPHQFEVPVAAADGVASADRSVILREVVREIARRHGTRATFTPQLHPSEQGNGLHIHLSLLDRGGRPLFHDPSRPANLSELGGRFAAGILKHAAALTALTAPSPVSWLRLQPGRRGAGAVCLGLRNREALLRIPPSVTFAGADAGAQLRLEYRAADAAANPYLALGALVHAGMRGIREQLPVPPLLERDPATLSKEDAARFGVGLLPGSLTESLQALAQDTVVATWLPTPLRELYTSVKQAEMEAAQDLALEAACAMYATVY